MRTSEIRSLARRAGVGPGVRVLDLCCGVAGPGRFITATSGCSYLGVDMSSRAIEVARARAAGLSCRFAVAAVPPVPSGPFDVVLLLETMLAFPDKQALLGEVCAALAPGGRFAFTVEAGRPLTESERHAMPAAETVWPVPVTELLQGLSRAGLHVRWVQELSRSHRLMADALADAVVAERSTIAAALRHDAVRDLITSHRLWSHWLATRRIRKLAFVAQKVDGPPLNATGRRPVEPDETPS
jgi:SAM-dependent methyltransferase